ncbi:hypothetical protein [Chryseobacterium vrystaatense]|uniref:Uncharacterized protein n=1 Tax=Chryseobacterium vrystaatense TaxID=307480 RepID=A0ABR4US14_9FLAO|nr:hypothetical protein [Chryseobacterium vrystaatense]KFF28052.1 hypothetical protein IW16_02205 [Chryseobacterium vrystaatense]
MDRKILWEETHAAVWRRPIKHIFTPKDMYEHVIEDIDISEMNIDYHLNAKQIFEWIMQNPEYDYKGLLESQYSNEELFRFFKIYYEYIIFRLDKYFNGDYLIRLSEIENM